MKRATTLVILSVILSALARMPFTVTASKPTFYGGAFYSIRNDNWLYKWDWSERAWKAIGIDRRVYKHGFMDGPVIGLGDGEFLVKMDSGLSHVSAEGVARPVLEEVRGFTHNPEAALVVALSDTLKTVRWPSGEVSPIPTGLPLSRNATYVGPSVTSRGDRVVVGGSDGRIHVARVGEWRFRAVASGWLPAFSASGRRLAYVLPGDKGVYVFVRDMDTGKTRRHFIADAYPGFEWVGDEKLIFGFEAKAPFALYPRTEHSLVDAETGERSPMPVESDGHIFWLAGD